MKEKIAELQDLIQHYEEHIAHLKSTDPLSEWIGVFQEKIFALSNRIKALRLQNIDKPKSQTHGASLYLNTPSPIGTISQVYPIEKVLEGRHGNVLREHLLALLN
jgi:hypothetical protein